MNNDNRENETERELANRDPITDAPGSHPVGTGIGAATAGTAGAALGAMAGPAGALAGAAIGAAIGGAIGHQAGEAIDPTVEIEYWRTNYASRPYVAAGDPYDDYGPAYQLGWESRENYTDQTFDAVEPNLRSDWDRRRGTSKLNWDHARQATRDAWERVDSRRKQ